MICRVSGQVKHLVNQHEVDKGKLTAVVSFEKPTFLSVSPSSEQSGGLWVVCVYITGV